MIKRLLQITLIIVTFIIPVLLPHTVQARNWRLYYDNAAERARRACGGCCSGTLACLTAASGIAGGGTNPITSLTNINLLIKGLQDGGLPGYYYGKVYIRDTDAFGNVTVRTETGFFPIAIAPRGGPGNEADGSSPIPVAGGILRARAREVAPTSTSCSDVYASTTYVNTSFNVSPRGTPAGSQTVKSGNYAAWGVLPGTKTVSANPPANYVLQTACWRSENPTTSGTGLSAAIAANQTVTWDLGFSNGTNWPQVLGGDVYAFSDISSYIPITANPRKFLLDGTGNSSAIVTYGNSADFDVNTGSTGGSYVSTKNWLAKDNYPRTDYYQLMYRRFGGPTTVNFTNETITQSQATSSATPYYATGDITTSGDWVIGDGETLIMLIDGNLTIGGKIQSTGTGFVAFIVNGNITVSPSVGSAYNSTTPALQGVYITSPNGIFITGQSTVSGSERFVGKGIFVAGEFQNQRDLSNIGGTNYNNTYAPELYQYDPQLLLTMPSAMKDGKVVWQEVAP